MLDYKQKGYRIPNLSRSCRFLSEWDENQSPLGSGRYWPEHFAECNWEGSNYYDHNIAYAVFDRIEKSKGWDNPEASYYFGDSDCCNCHCAGFMAVPSLICEKHDIEYEVSECCPVCEDESYQRMIKDEEDWRRKQEEEEQIAIDLDMQKELEAAEAEQYRSEE